MSAAQLSPAATGRLMADEDVHDAVQRLIGQMDTSARAQAVAGPALAAEDVEYLAGRHARLTQIRDGLAGAINAVRGGG